MNRPGNRFLWKILLLLVCTLPISQLGALAHACSHAAGYSAAGSMDHSGLDKGEPCAKCVQFAPLLATAGGSAQVVIIAHSGIVPSPETDFVSRLCSGPTAAFRSRAPPRDSAAA